MQFIENCQTILIKIMPNIDTKEQMTRYETKTIPR